MITVGQVMNGYRDLKTKLLKYSAYIFLNKQCANRKVTPAYAKINRLHTAFVFLTLYIPTPSSHSLHNIPTPLPL
jgi:hypothetical protein